MTIITVIHDIRGVASPRCVICRREPAEIANEPTRPCTFPPQLDAIMRPAVVAPPAIGLGGTR